MNFLSLNYVNSELKIIISTIFFSKRFILSLYLLFGPFETIFFQIRIIF